MANKIREYLANVRNRNNSKNFQNSILKKINDEKKIYLNQDNQNGAKLFWCYEQIIKTQFKYLEAFNELVKKQYYNAWVIFEQIELKLKFLSPHFDINDDEYLLSYINKYVKKFQSLYPYKLFMSPEIVEHEKKCNICGNKISIRKPCGHVIGEIYNGKMCYRIVTSAEVIGVAFVKSPIQKYSVPFTIDQKSGEKVDQYNYAFLEYVIKVLKTPFDNWDVKFTKKTHPHSMFNNVGRNDKCPCNSGKKYKICCLPKTGVTMPHCIFSLPYEIPEELQKTKFV